MQHPARDQINMGLGATTLRAGAVVMDKYSEVPWVQVVLLVGI